MELTFKNNTGNPSIPLPIYYSGKVRTTLTKTWLNSQEGFIHSQGPDDVYNTASNVLPFNHNNTRDFNWNASYYNWVKRNQGENVNTVLDIYNITNELLPILSDLGIDTSSFHLDEIPVFELPQVEKCAVIDRRIVTETIRPSDIDIEATYYYTNMPYEEYSIIELDESLLVYDTVERKLSQDPQVIQGYINYIASNGMPGHITMESLDNVIGFVNASDILRFNIAKFLGLDSIPVCIISYENNTLEDLKVRTVNNIHHSLYGVRDE